LVEDREFFLFPMHLYSVYRIGGPRENFVPICRCKTKKISCRRDRAMLHVIDYFAKSLF